MTQAKMTDSEYYSLQVNSSSIIKHLNPEEGGSPKKYLSEIQNLDKRKNDSIFTETGKLAHMYKLEPDKFDVDPLDKPTEQMLVWVQEVYKASGYNNLELDPQDVISNDLVFDIKTKFGLQKGMTKEETILKNFWTQNTKDYMYFLTRASGRLLLSPSTKEKITNINRSMDQHQGVDFYLTPSAGIEVYNELPLFFEVSNFSSLTGQTIMIPFKSKLDSVRVELSKLKFTIIDIKTGFSSAYTLNNFLIYRIYRQLAVYRQAILKNLEMFGIKREDANKVEFEYKIIAVETQEPFNCVIHSIDPMWILKKGNAELSDFLKRVAFHEVYGYDQSIEEFIGNGEIVYKYVNDPK